MTTCGFFTIESGHNDFGNIQPEYHSNYDLENIITPVKVEVLVKNLKDAGYPSTEIEFLRQGFTEGFNIGYEGP